MAKSQSFRALWRDPVARRILTANFLLIVGSGLTFMAVPWILIKEPSGEAILGFTNATVTLGILILLPYLGAMIDRHSRKRIVLGYFLAGLTVNLLTAALIAFEHGRVEVWELLLVYAFGSLGASIYYPAQFALNQEVFSPDQYEVLSGALEVQWQAGAMLSGAIGVILIGRVPLPIILVLDAATFLSGFVLLRKLRYQRQQRTRLSAWRMLGESVDYLRQRPRLSVVLMASFLPFVALMVSNYLTPIFIQQTLRGGPEIYATGEIAYAAGAVLAGLTIPSINARWHLVRTLLLTTATFAVATLIIPALPIVAVFLIAFGFQGWGNAGSRVARSTLILKTVPNEVVGRVNLFYGAAERVLRTILLVVVTTIVLNHGPNPSYFLLGSLAASACVVILFCRGVRTHQLPAGVSAAEVS